MKAYIHKTSEGYIDKPTMPFEGCKKEGFGEAYIYTYEASAEELLCLSAKVGYDIIVSNMRNSDGGKIYASSRVDSLLMAIEFGCDVDIEIYDDFRE